MRPVRRALRRSFVFLLLFLGLTSQARASVSPITGAIPIFTEPGVVVKFDAAFDEVNQVYLVVWASMAVKPAQGQFLDANGNPVGGPFPVSAGGEHAGFVRVSAGGGRFFVSYTKAFGDRGPFLQMARMVAYNGGQPSFQTGDIPIDTIDHFGSDAGTVYVPGTGKFIVTWWKNRNFAQSFATTVDTAGNVGPVAQVSDNSDGSSDPEIACDPASNRCVVVGYYWDSGHVRGGGTWARSLDAATAQPVGGMSLVDLTYLQEDQNVAFSVASNQFVAAWVRRQSLVVAKNLNADGVPITDLRALVSGASDTCGEAGYGQINSSLKYNRRTGTLAIGAVDYCGMSKIAELDGNGNPIPGGLQTATGIATPTAPQNPIIASNDGAGQFLFAHNFKFITPHARLFGGSGTGPGPGPGNPPGRPPSVTIDYSNPAVQQNGSWFLAEGAATPSSLGYKTFYLVVNPNAVNVDLRVYYAAEDGYTISKSHTVLANSRLTLNLQNEAGPGAYATVFQSLTASADVRVERSIYWGFNLEGSTGATAARSAAQTWYFAEGSRGGERFANYFLLFNPTSQPAAVTLTFYFPDGQSWSWSPENGGTIGPQQRLSIDANAFPRLALSDFSTVVTSSVPIVAERAMYWGWNGEALWTGGTESLGSTMLNDRWFFAEGAAAAGFQTYYLLWNPNPQPITVTGSFRPVSGTALDRPVRTFQLPPHARVTVELNHEFGNVGGVAADFVSTGGAFLAERSSYWGTGVGGWVEGVNVIGLPGVANEWFLPEGSTGGLFQTYLLLLNPYDTDLDVAVTLYLENSEGKHTGTVRLPAFSRQTVDMADFILNTLQQPGLLGKSFATRVGVPLDRHGFVAEHALYWNYQPGNYWRGGSAATGAPTALQILH